MKIYARLISAILILSITLLGCKSKDKDETSEKPTTTVGDNKVKVGDTEAEIKAAFITPYGEDWTGFYNYSLNFSSITSIEGFMVNPKGAKLSTLSATIAGIDIYSKSSTFATGTYNWVDGDDSEQEGVEGGVIILGADFSSIDDFDFASSYYFIDAKLVYTKSGGTDQYTLTGKVVSLSDFIGNNTENALDILLNFKGSTQELEPEEEEFEFGK